jgi:hypothetical protein
MEHPDPKARKATWVRKVLQDRRDRLVPRATPARQALKETLERWDRRASKDHKDHKDSKDLKDPWDSKGRKAPQELLDLQGCKGTLVKKGPPDLRDRQVPTARPDLKVRKAT